MCHIIYTYYVHSRIGMTGPLTTKYFRNKGHFSKLKQQLIVTMPSKEKITTYSDSDEEDYAVSEFITQASSEAYIIEGCSNQPTTSKTGSKGNLGTNAGTKGRSNARSISRGVARSMAGSNAGWNTGSNAGWNVGLNAGSNAGSNTGPSIDGDENSDGSEVSLITGCKLFP